MLGIGELPGPHARPRLRSTIRGTKPLRRFALRLFLYLLGYSLFLQFILAYVVSKDARLLPSTLQRSKSLLIVTAHPDDECLFFAPSILGILEENLSTKGGLLVLSTGQ